VSTTSAPSGSSLLVIVDLVSAQHTRLKAGASRTTTLVPFSLNERSTVFRRSRRFVGIQPAWVFSFIRSTQNQRQHANQKRNHHLNFFKQVRNELKNRKEEKKKKKKKEKGRKTGNIEHSFHTHTHVHPLTLVSSQ
jgi:hypothetical protein